MTPEAAAEIVGADHVLAGAEAGAAAVAGVAPTVVAVPGSVPEAVALIRAVAEAGGALVPRGGGTHIEAGRAPSRLDLLLDTRRLSRVVDYQPDDMTVTLEPGVTLAALAAVLAPRGQFLPLDPPRPAEATVGGTVAAAATGAWRAGYGAPRDWVIGCRVIGADGVEVRAGGQVVKNVAGYDLPKLYTGSFGTLGLITEVTFKVLPCPPARGACSIACPSPEAMGDVIRQVLDSDLQPTAVEAVLEPGTDSDTWLLTLEFRHVEEAVEWQCGQLRALAADAGLPCERLHDELADSRIRQAAELSLSEAFVARLGGSSARFANLAPAAADVCRAHGVAPRIAGHAATGQVYVAAAEATPALARDLREMVRRHQALCVFPRLPAALHTEVDPWDEPGPELALMRAIKATLDPAGVFSPGRFVGGI